MPSTSAAQHRWIGYLHSNPEAAEKAGMSEAKVNEWLHADKGKPWTQKRDMGGATTSMAQPAPTAANQNPLQQGVLQQYSSLPDEKLQELAARLGGTSQGQMINQLLQRRRMMPQAQPQQAQVQAPQTQPLEKGGPVKRDVGGGMPSGILNEPERLDAREDSGGGFLHGTTPGRADQIKTQAPPGAYVVPAEVVAHLGEGNSLAGARVMQNIVSSGPFGTPLPRQGRGMGMPRPPAMPADERSTMKAGGTIPIFQPKLRRGGANTGQTPVDLSDGEFVITPEQCEALGGGDREKGHRILDRWVVNQHKKHIAELKKYKGPVTP